MIGPLAFTLKPNAPRPPRVMAFRSKRLIFPRAVADTIPKSLAKFSQITDPLPEESSVVPATERLP